MFELLRKHRKFRVNSRRFSTDRYKPSKCNVQSTSEPYVQSDTTSEPYVHKHSGVGIFGNILLLALTIFVLSTAMLAWQLGDNVQVNAYSAYRRGLGTVYSNLPRLLTGISADTVQPMLLITEGVAKVIIDSTVSYRNRIAKAEPMRKLVNELEILETDYMKHKIALIQAIDGNILDMDRKMWFTDHIYEAHNRVQLLKDELSSLKKPFLARTSAKEFYEYKSIELPKLISLHESSITALQIGDIGAVLSAFELSEQIPKETTDYVKSKVRSITDEITKNYDSNKYSVGITYHPTGVTTIRLGPTDFEADFKHIDERLKSQLFENLFPDVILDLIRNQLKLKIILLSIESIQMVLMNEKAKDTWKQISNEFKDSDVIIGGITGAINTLLQTCAKQNDQILAKCQLKSQLQYLPDILREFTVHDFHLPSPEKFLETIIRENSRRNPKLVSLQDILLLKDIEEFRQNPNIWISLTAISSGLAIGTFVSAIIFGLGYSMLYGIIGSIMNVAGIVFDTTSIVRKQFQMNGNNKLKLTAIKGYQQQICDLADLQKTIQDTNFTNIELPSGPVFEELDDDQEFQINPMNFNPLLLTADGLR